MGCYEVLRQASSAQVADAVGLDASTVSEVLDSEPPEEHLQRAQRNIVEGFLGPDGWVAGWLPCYYAARDGRAARRGLLLFTVSLAFVGAAAVLIGV